MTSDHLVTITYHPRVFGYLLAILILTQVDHGTHYVHAWIIALLAYPQLLNRYLIRLGETRVLTGPVMAIDALVTGLLISLVDFNFEAGIVLVSLISISTLVVGGFTLWLLLLPVAGFGMFIGSFLHPERFSGDAGFYFVSLSSLVAYVCFIGVLVYQETRRLNVEQKQMQSIRQKLEKFRTSIMPYLSSEQVSRDDGFAGYSRKRLTVLFADLEGFTCLMDTADEALVADMLNRYFGEMALLAKAHGGTINKFIGDGVMVFFGGTRSHGPAVDAVNCVLMAIEMRSRFRQLSRDWEVTGGVPLHLRMGIHTGYCLLGDFGSDERRDYTALGSVVNLASRLEGLANRDEILISAETRRLVEAHIHCTPRGEMAVKGFSDPVTTWSVNDLAVKPVDSAQVRLLS